MRWRRLLYFCSALMLGALVNFHRIEAADVASPPVREAVSAAAWERMPPHPRLFANNERMAALRAQGDPISRELKARVISEANRNLTVGRISFVDRGGFLLGQMGEAQGRIVNLALAFRLTGEERYFLRAREELMILADVPNWGTNHMLDIGVASVAAGVGLDWLYDHLTDEERSKISHAIADKALRPSLLAQEGKGGWVDGNFNWNQVCNGGLSVGAIGIAEIEPELGRRIVNRAVANVPRAADAYEPDGTYAEGTGYWSFGTTYQAILIDALRTALGTSGGLDRPGFVKSPDFIAQMIAPSGDDYDFSDYHRRNPAEPVMFWFARERRQRDVAREALGILQHARGEGGSQEGAAGFGRQIGFALLWWDPTLPQQSAAPLPLNWIAKGELPLAVFRSAWNDPKATYLAIKGGTPNNSHAHMDVGSFILEAGGVRWAIDLGSENYNKMRAAKLDLWSYAQTSTRWTTFRAGPEAHNIVRFDQDRQQIDGHGKIRPMTARDSSSGAVVDLDSLYVNKVSTMKRQVELQRDASVALQDTWTTRAAPVEVSWQWLTRADVKATTGGLRLEQSGAALELAIKTDTPFTTEIEDVSAARALQDSPNPGVKRIVVKLRTPANSTGHINVNARLAPRSR